MARASVVLVKIDDGPVIATNDFQYERRPFKSWTVVVQEVKPRELGEVDLVIEADGVQWSGRGLVTNSQMSSGRPFKHTVVSNGEMRELEGDDIEESLRRV